MGIPLLNRFLKHKCSKKGIYKVPFNELRDKVIVVDANNFVYRFLSENALLENFYFMISIFRYYNIKPLFVPKYVPKSTYLVLPLRLWPRFRSTDCFSTIFRTTARSTIVFL